MTEDRVHPSDDTQQPQNDDKPLLPPQGTYVIQIPKDQIFRNPPPENSLKLHKFANRKPRRSSCCRCFCFTISALIIILLLLTVLYFVFRPEKPTYSIDKLSITGVNLTSSSPLNLKMNLNITSQNPNDKISVFYIKGSEVNVYYDDVKLCNGVLPVFEHKPNNVTVIQTVLRGNGVVLARDVHARLVKQDKGRNVPLKLKVKAPVKVKIGAVKTWEIMVTVKCDVAVNRFTTKSKIVSKSCGYRVKLW
ncbi:NDR1/HIN1-like protein 13 [Tanacetum coccineum]